MSTSKATVAIIGSGYELEGKLSFLSSCLLQMQLHFMITVPSGTLHEMNAPLDDPVVTQRELLYVLECSRQHGECAFSLHGQSSKG